MRYLFMMLIIGGTINASFGQKITKNDLSQIELEKHKKIVRNALQLNDYNTAINSLHHIIAIEGEKSSYNDTLALNYFFTQRYASSYLLSEKLLKNNHKNNEILKINAISLKQLGRDKEAINAFEKLFILTNNMSDGYELAILQFGLKRLQEAQETISKTILCEDSEHQLEFKLSDNASQRIPIKAGVYNLKGLIAYEQNDIENAVASFKEALDIAPEFVLAKKNLDAISNAKKNQPK